MSDFTKNNMATPYFQIFTGEVPSTQDLARESIKDLPVVVIAPSQARGRGRAGAGWENAPRALAVSAAWRPDQDDRRPFSLMAGVAAVRSLPVATELKWPNDLLTGRAKVGGILVEQSGGVAVAGMGLNLFWPDPPEGIGAIDASDPGDEAHRVIGALWAATFFELERSTGWPADEYRRSCATLGREITWEPNGRGIASGIDDDGSLLVETSAGVEAIHAGAVRHLRG